MRRLLLVLVLAAGCGDNKAAGDVDAGGTADAAVAVTPDASTTAMVARGDYLMNHVVACGDCHTPRNADGTPDLTRQFAGVDCFVDSDPADDTMGCLSTRNLTNDPTGLANYSDQQIKDMFQKGMLPGGQFLNPFMPYYVFANMTDDDASSIVAYLRTVPGVNHEVMAQQPPWNNVTMPASAIDPMLIPKAPAGNASAANGRYLSSMSGLCIECHTPDAPAGQTVPIDMSRPFSGGQDFQPGFPSPPFPAHIYSANITPDPTGIADYTATDIVNVLLQGVDNAGHGVCPPMPTGPMGAYGGLTPSDAMDIANYILTVPAISNQIPNTCIAPGT